MNQTTDPLDSSAVADPLYNVNLTEDELARFWEKVGPPDANGCLPWVASLTRYGYGVIKIRKRRPAASRVSYLIHFGAFDLSMDVLHTCDNRKCVNPKHLFLGTQLDNMRDMDAKGRRKSVGFDYLRISGPNCTHARLTLPQVLEIRERRSRREKLRVLAAEFGVSEATISLVARKLNWRHH